MAGLSWRKMNITFILFVLNMYFLLIFVYSMFWSCFPLPSSFQMLFSLLTHPNVFLSQKKTHKTKIKQAKDQKDKNRKQKKRNERKKEREREIKEEKRKEKPHRKNCGVCFVLANYSWAWVCPGGCTLLDPVMLPWRTLIFPLDISCKYLLY